jgi:hypothetical protein
MHEMIQLRLQSHTKYDKLFHEYNHRASVNKERLRDYIQCFFAAGFLSEQQAPDPFIIAKSKQLNRRVTLNVGGVRYNTYSARFLIGRFSELFE